MTLDTIPDSNTHIQKAQHAVIARMEAAPEKAQSTLRTCGLVEDGLACRVTQGKFEALLDLGLAMGGTATGPSPGFCGRAAIAGCVAIAVKMLAAREGVAFSRVDVAVEMDFDDAALFGVGQGNAAPLATRVAVDIETFIVWVGVNVHPYGNWIILHIRIDEIDFSLLIEQQPIFMGIAGNTDRNFLAY